LLAFGELGVAPALRAGGDNCASEWVKVVGEKEIKFGLGERNEVLFSVF
jgi:hypothetical protein